jgi:GT2 family glycosyltransferase
VVTLVAGRRHHLVRQQQALARSAVPTDDYIVVAMSDHDARRHVQAGQPAAHVVEVPLCGGHLPLASARNAGAEAALARGAELLVFLDVDCLPAPELVGRYVEAAGIDRRPGRVLCGPVANLPPPPDAGYDLTTLANNGVAVQGRPIPRPHETIESQDFTLFWSLSFAITAASWRNVGGFSDDYLGYGAEDTDFAQHLRASGGSICWVGGAWAYHQHHPKTDPPVEHLHDIVRNARIFKARWGWWPMGGWLTTFEELHLLHHDPDTDDWLLE